MGRPNNAPQALALAEKVQQAAIKVPRVFIASIHPELSESDVREVFESFGKIVSCEFPKDHLVT